jgi:uracil-DNA glycosylase
MLDGETHDLHAEAESLIGWWRDAGVDILIDEEPRNWLAEARPVARNIAPGGGRPAHEGRAPLPKSAPASAPALLVLPKTLPDFLAWLATDTSTLADYPVRQRLAPEGDTASVPMVVTDVPERGDAEAGQLLTGESGALFDKMLSAWKIDRSHIYLASVAPARPAGALMDKAALDLLTPLLVHHIRLAAPKKLWLMGEAASRAVLGVNVAEARGRLHTINYDGVTVEAIATLHPRVLVGNPKFKGQVWADMQKLIGPDMNEGARA